MIYYNKDSLYDYNGDSYNYVTLQHIEIVVIS